MRTHCSPCALCRHVSCVSLHQSPSPVTTRTQVKPFAYVAKEYATGAVAKGSELKWLLSTEGMKAVPLSISFYFHNDGSGAPGRLMLKAWCSAIANEAFRQMCPVLYAIVSVYVSVLKGDITIMITWRDALWCHNDLRALVGGWTDVTGYGRYKAMQLSLFSKPYPGFLTMHTIMGDDSKLVYTQRPNSASNAKAHGPKFSVKVGRIVMECCRPPGWMRAAPAWVHAGCGHVQKIDNVPYVAELPWERDVMVDRVSHAVIVDGELGATVSIFTKATETELE